MPIWIADLINVPFKFGGTSLLIVVGVALDTMAQMQQHLLLDRKSTRLNSSPTRRSSDLMPIWIADLINVPFKFGGTSLLIVVGVALDTMAQMQQHLLLRKYDGFMKKGRVKFRGRSATGGF